VGIPGRVAVSASFLLVLSVVAPSALGAQDVRSHDGFWFSIGLGYGSLGSEAFNGRQGGEAAQIALGGTVSNRLLVGASFKGWTRLENGVQVEVGVLTAMARFYTSDTGGLFLTGGLGGGWIDSEVSSLPQGRVSGFGGFFGLGHDIRVGARVSLTPFWNLYWVGNSDADANIRQVGIGVTFR
jgi:hypothetical protein